MEKNLEKLKFKLLSMILNLILFDKTPHDGSGTLSIDNIVNLVSLPLTSKVKVSFTFLPTIACPKMENEL